MMRLLQITSVELLFYKVKKIKGLYVPKLLSCSTSIKYFATVLPILHDQVLPVNHSL